MKPVSQSRAVQADQANHRQAHRSLGELVMKCPAVTPFDRIEAAQYYLALLSASVVDNKERIEADIVEATNDNSPRFLEVLKLGFYNLERLEKQLKATRQTLNNLRKLRRLLLSESIADATLKQKADEISGTKPQTM
jgi:hypothetical protein